MLLLCSSPLAIISAIESAWRIINAKAMDNAQMWLAWVQSSSWFAAIVFQFLPNALIFVSMYIIIPSAHIYLSKFERHLIVFGELRAALLKMSGEQRAVSAPQWWAISPRWRARQRGAWRQLRWVQACACGRCEA
nr:CSC1-like protein At4g35870 [Ipomoea batatas]